MGFVILSVFICIVCFVLYYISKRHIWETSENKYLSRFYKFCWRNDYMFFAIFVIFLATATLLIGASVAMNSYLTTSKLIAEKTIERNYIVYQLENQIYVKRDVDEDYGLYDINRDSSYGLYEVIEDAKEFDSWLSQQKAEEKSFWFGIFTTHVSDKFEYINVYGNDYVGIHGSGTDKSTTNEKWQLMML